MIYRFYRFDVSVGLSGLPGLRVLAGLRRFVSGVKGSKTSVCNKTPGVAGADPVRTGWAIAGDQNKKKPRASE